MLILWSMLGLCTYDSSLDVPGFIEGATFQTFTHAAARGAELHEKMAAACLTTPIQIVLLLFDKSR